jgi:hypothetical protein
MAHIRQSGGFENGRGVRVSGEAQFCENARNGNELEKKG